MVSSSENPPPNQPIEATEQTEDPVAADSNQMESKYDKETDGAE